MEEDSYDVKTSQWGRGPRNAWSNSNSRHNWGLLDEAGLHTIAQINLEHSCTNQI